VLPNELHKAQGHDNNVAELSLALKAKTPEIH